MPQITVIGDITVDNFIKLTSDYVHSNCRRSDQSCELILPFGAKIPVNDVEIKCGGNAANVAVGLKRLGVDILPIIPLGTDIYSTIALGQLEKEGISLHPNLLNPSYRCNSSYVLRYESDRTIFTHHEEKRYPMPEDFNTKFIYFSSHTGNNNQVATEMLALKNSNRSKLIFAPANTQIKGDKLILESIISHSYLLICNKDEAYEILSRIDDVEININYMLHRLHHFGAYHVVITDGANGVHYLNGDTEIVDYQKSLTKSEDVVDSTGAGDAMCTGVTYMLINGCSLEKGIQLGLKNSSSVLKFVGAQTGLLRAEDLK